MDLSNDKMPRLHRRIRGHGNKRDETIHHIVSECSKLAQKKYKRRYDWVGR